MQKLIKTAIILLSIFIGSKVIAQSTTEAGILKLSKQVFDWELENKFDSLESVFDDKFVLVGSSGERQDKKQYIVVLRSGNFVHNGIDVEESAASISNNTAIVTGKGKFAVTVSGNKVALHLSYMEVFTRPNIEAPWKILGMHASVLSK